MNETDIIKNRLRLDIKSFRRSLDSDFKSVLDQQIFVNLLKCRPFHDAKTALIYKSTSIEVGTQAIIDYCLANGIKAALPRCFENNSMRFYYYDGRSALERSSYGIYEPYANEQLEVRKFDNTVCIVPALAFDSEGYRLGYGGGYYDRFLASHKQIITIGICYSANILNRLVHSKFDVRVAYVATEKNLEDLNG